MKEIKIGKPFEFAGNGIDIEEGLYRVKYVDEIGYPYCEMFCKTLNKWVNDGWWWPDVVRKYQDS